MYIIATCSCGRASDPSDDWVGNSLTCPNCGSLVLIPSKPRSPLVAKISLASGVVALLLGLVAYSELVNRLLPRTISRVVEERRAENFFLASMIASLVAFGAAFIGRRSRSAARTLGLIFACVSFVLLMIVAYDSAHISARRAQCVNNLKQISLALANYESTYGAYPPRVISDRQGRPLLSWRVAILPFLEMQDLYAKFHLDEPWDSPHNLPLADQIPYAFVCPAQASWSRKQTLYVVLDGPGTFLDTLRPMTVAEIKDGPAETLAVVEGNSPIPWSSPQDLPFDLGKPFPAWEATHPGGFNASFADGSVRFQKRTMPEADLKASATRNGLEKSLSAEKGENAPHRFP